MSPDPVSPALLTPALQLGALGLLFVVILFLAGAGWFLIKRIALAFDATAATLRLLDTRITEEGRAAIVRAGALRELVVAEARETRHDLRNALQALSLARH